MDSRTAWLPFAALLAAWPLDAQTVLRVGPGRPFTDVAAALASAAAGDVVLVDAGTYPGFVLAGDVRLRAEPAGAVVRIASPVDLQLPPAAAAAVEGLTFGGYVRSQSTQPPGIVRPTIAFDACRFEDTIVFADLDAAFAQCVLASARYEGLSAAGDSVVAAVQCTIQGGVLTQMGPVGPSGIALSQNARAHLSGCTVTGGLLRVLPSQTVPAPGILLRHGSGVWLVDCTVDGGSGPRGLALAIDNQSTAAAVVDRCALNPSMPAQPTSGIVRTELLVGIGRRGGGPQRGAAWQVDLRTAPGLLLGIHASLRLGAPTAHPLLAEPEWGFAAGSTWIGLWIADGAGNATVQVTVPNVPALAHQWVSLCAWSGPMGPPLPVSPPLGGLVR